MKTYAYIIAFFLVLVVPFILRARLADDADAGAAQYSDRLVIVTPHNQDIRREFARAFAEWHRKKYGYGVTIDYRMPGGTNDIKRLLVTTYNSVRLPDHSLPPEDRYVAGIHLVWGGGDDYFNRELKPEGFLKPIQLDPAVMSAAFPRPTLGGVKLLDVTKDTAGNVLPPRWVGVCLSSFGIVYNPDIYAALALAEPKQWVDLTTEKLSGMIALADPSHSGSAAVAYMMVLQRAMADAELEALANKPALKSLDKPDLAKNADYRAALARGWKKGMSQLLLIAANARYFTDSGEQVPTDVGNGEAAAGMAIDFFGRVESETVGPARARFIAPAAATAITPDPIAILYGTTGHELELANHFIEFLLSPEGQRLWELKPGTPGGPKYRGLRRAPIRTDVYADRTNWSDDINPFTEAASFNMRGEWMVLFSDTRPLWAAAWIDSREALTSAYQKILAVPDPTRRTQLLAELANLPIELHDVEELAGKRKSMEADHVSTDEWKALQRIEWARKFREHYAGVANQAR